MGTSSTPLECRAAAHTTAARRNVTSRPVSRVLSGGFPPRRPFVWGAGCRAPRATNPGGSLDETRRSRGFPRGRHAAPIWSCSRWGLPCQRRYRRCGALLPHRFTLAWAAPVTRLDPSAVSFLWHCPWGRPRRPLAATVHPWSPDFPPPARDCQNANATAATVQQIGRAHV